MSERADQSESENKWMNESVGAEGRQVGTDRAGEGAAREPAARERRTPDTERAPGPRHLPSAWQLSRGGAGRGG